MSGSTSTSQNSSVVYITVDDGFYIYQGSGVLISPDEVLTASHIADKSFSGSGFSVSPGYAGGAAPFGTFTASYTHSNAINDVFGTISTADIQNDFAIIHLSTSVSGAGQMGLLPDYGGGSAYAAQYPADKYGAQVITQTALTPVAGYNVFQTAANSPGASGGPLWVLQNGQPDVVGVTSAEQSDGTGLDVKLTGADVSQIQQWVFQDDLTNPLIDPAYYDAANPDVVGAPFSAAYHYESYGWYEGRNPDAFFSSIGYLAANPDVRAARIDPLLQYEATGWREGRDPSATFDTRLYLLHNPDVAASGMDPLVHYLEYGKAEGRPAYAAIGPGNTIVGGFDPTYYLLANPDVAASGLDPLFHFDTYGWEEGRNPNAVFNTRDYELANPDVLAAGINPLVHYDLYGWHEGRNPSSAFNTNAYLAANPNVAAAHVDPMQQYLVYGALLGRSPLGSA